MKTLIAALVATLTLGAAHAADVMVQVKPTPGYHLNQQELYDLEQSFALSNGQTMKFTTNLTRIFVQVDRGSRVEIFPVAKDRFKSDAGTEFEFRDDNETVAVANFGLLPMAEAPAKAMVLARR
ncbi:gel scht [Pseudoduganella danionis]|uniref:Gel scht n=1 Tax=Pseudoduganella danionis TaxID=1890295 RepID=A0ABW9SJN2_9BURK|nr:gel scht [Pseudoduganella danionis]MTW31408.1 gel scht [Pseudoduganella danionis]